jgi:hypothetical protein
MSTHHVDRFRDLYDEWGVYMTDERPPGTAVGSLAVHLRLDGELLERKLTALRAMATQTSDVMSAIEPDLFAHLVAEECFVDAARPQPPGGGPG